MEAAAEILEEHELWLGILSGHIIPERCKPQQSRCVRCGESARDGRIYCERCVASRTTGNLASLKPPGLEQVTLERGPNSRLTIYGETYVIHPVVGEEIARLRRELKGATVERGRWSVERARLMAERDEALKRARREGLDEGIARSWEAAAKDVDALSKGEEESKGEGGCTGTAQEPGAPASPSRGACGREASSPAAPSLREEMLAFLDGWGVGIGTTCGDAVSEVLDSWETQHRKLRKAAQAVVEEAPHQIEFLWEQGSNGHAASLKRAADRLEAALKETPDATP